jgi:hypothetical protein
MRTPEEVFLENAERIQEEYNRDTRQFTADGGQFALSKRQLDYLRGVLATADDEIAESIRELLWPPREPAEEASQHGPGCCCGDETAGQEPDPTSYGFWYALPTRSRLKPAAVIGVARTLVRCIQRIKITPRGESAHPLE